MSKRIYAGTLRETDIDRTVVLKGWVDRRRDLGGLIFIDLRDRSGIVQVVFNPDHNQEAHAIAETVRSEYVVEVHGTVVKRDEETVNPLIDTGTIEVIADEIKIINKAKTPPFLIEDKTDVSEDPRLYRR